MGCLFVDGSHHMGTGVGSDDILAKKYTGVAFATIVTTGPNGGYGIELGTLRKTLFNSNGSGQSFANMWKFRMSSITGGDFGNGAGYSISCLSVNHQLQAVFTLYLEQDGIFSIFGGNILQDRIFSVPIHEDVFYTIETNVFVAVSGVTGKMVGTYYVRINGIQVASGALTTDISAAALLTTRPTSFGFFGSSKGFCTIAYPIIYDDSGDIGATFQMTSALSGGSPLFWAGDCRILTVFPNGDVVTDWTPSSGTAHYSLINETGPPNESNYVSSDTPGNIDVYDWQDVPSNVEILTIQHSIYGKKSDAGTRVISHRCGNTGSETFGDVISLADDYYYAHAARDSNPTTGLQWTPTTFNAKRFGQKLES